MTKANNITTSQAVEATNMFSSTTMLNAEKAQGYSKQREELGMNKDKKLFNKVKKQASVVGDALVEVIEAELEGDTVKAEKAVEKAATAATISDTVSRELEQQNLADIAVDSVRVFIEKTVSMGEEAKDIVDNIEYSAEEPQTVLLYRKAKRLSVVITDAVNGLHPLLEKAHRGANVPDADVSQSALNEVQQLYEANCERLESLKGFHEQIKNIIAIS